MCPFRALCTPRLILAVRFGPCFSGEFVHFFFILQDAKGLIHIKVQKFTTTQLASAFKAPFNAALLSTLLNHSFRGNIGMLSYWEMSRPL